jgi:hypothetical protein
VNGVRVPVARNIGRVPFGPQHRGKVRIHWDGTVNGHPLRPGRYRITLRALKDVKHIVETARPDVLRIAR